MKPETLTIMVVQQPAQQIPLTAHHLSPGSHKPTCDACQKSFFQKLVSQQIIETSWQPYCQGPEGTNRP